MLHNVGLQALFFSYYLIEMKNAVLFSELMKEKQYLKRLITCWLLMSYGDSIMHQIIILTEKK